MRTSLHKLLDRVIDNRFTIHSTISFSFKVYLVENKLMFLFETKTSRLLSRLSTKLLFGNSSVRYDYKRARYVLDIGRSNRKEEQSLSLSMS